MAPKAPKAPKGKTPVPTAASSRPTRATTLAPPPSAVAPPAASSPKISKTTRRKEKRKAADLTIATEDRRRPLFSHPRLEDHVRTRILDLEHIHRGLEAFSASEELMKHLGPGIDILQACINSLRSITPEEGPGFGSPDGNPDSSIVGSPDRTVKKRRRIVKERPAPEAITKEAVTKEAVTTEAEGSEAESSEAEGSEAEGSEAEGSEAEGSEVEVSEAEGSEAEGGEASKVVKKTAGKRLRTPS